MASLVVPARFTGPPSSGNGGWVAGALAALLPAAAAVTVRLSAPPPLDVPLDVVPDGAGLRLESDGTLVATATPADAAAADPYDTGDAFVDLDVARAAGASYPDGDAHPFPSCVVCSPVHPDGLRLRPWRPAGGPAGVAATPWTPDASLGDDDGLATTAAVWAALDCPGGWAVGLGGRVMLLGTVTGTVARRPAVGEECVVAGTARGGAGRKEHSTTTLFAADGERLAWCAQVWIAVDIAVEVPAVAPS